MSEDDNFSLHSYEADDQDEQIEDFYKQLSLQFYTQENETNKKVSLLMSGSTQSKSKPSRDTLPEVGLWNALQPKQLSPSSSRAASNGRSHCKSPPKMIQIHKQANILNKNKLQLKSPIRPFSPSAKQPHQTQKLIKLLQSPYNTKGQQNQKQLYIQKQFDAIRNLQLQELKDHYYK